MSNRRASRFWLPGQVHCTTSSDARNTSAPNTLVLAYESTKTAKQQVCQTDLIISKRKLPLELELKRIVLFHTTLQTLARCTRCLGGVEVPAPSLRGLRWSSS